MAIVTRYFGITSAGAGDGTTWANRAQFINSGAFSTVITGFNFGASDSMLGLVEEGAHGTISTGLASGTFTVAAPTAANPLVLHGCDSSGNILEPPDPGWASCEEPWDDSGLPVLNTTSNISTVNCNHVYCRLLKLTTSGVTTNTIVGSGTAHCDWCWIEASSSHSSLFPTGGSSYSNCVIKATGASYSALTSSAAMENCRLIGNAEGSSGNRSGIASTANAVRYQRCTIVDNPGIGMSFTGSSTAFSARVIGCTVLNSGSHGVQMPSTASITSLSQFQNNLVANSGGYGVDFGGTRCNVGGNRYRDNVSGNTTGGGNYPAFYDFTTDSDDDAEFVNAAGGDFRIKSTSDTWGLGLGPADEPPSGGGTHAFGFIG